jgi:hypothetical protein
MGAYLTWVLGENARDHHPWHARKLGDARLAADDDAHDHPLLTAHG